MDELDGWVDNPDVDLRELERLAVAGDVDADRRLLREQLRRKLVQPLDPATVYRYVKLYPGSTLEEVASGLEASGSRLWDVLYELERQFGVVEERRTCRDEYLPVQSKNAREALDLAVLSLEALDDAVFMKDKAEFSFALDVLVDRIRSAASGRGAPRTRWFTDGLTEALSRVSSLRSLSSGRRVSWNRAQREMEDLGHILWDVVIRFRNLGTKKKKRPRRRGRTRRRNPWEC